MKTLRKVCLTSKVCLISKFLREEVVANFSIHLDLRTYDKLQFRFRFTYSIFHCYNVNKMYILIWRINLANYTLVDTTDFPMCIIAYQSVNSQAESKSPRGDHQIIIFF